MTIPADSPCAGCISRRSFVTRSAVATATFLAACGDGRIGGTAITDPAGPKQIKVGDFPGLSTPGTIVLVDASRAVKRIDASTFSAFSRSCTHEGTAVNLSGSGLSCPTHGSAFDNDGQVTAGPATRDLTRLVTAYDPATDLLTIG